MRFLVDAQLPVALARWLTAQACDATHVYDLGMECSKDSDIWDHALESGAVLVSKDEDFVNLALVKEVSPQLVWIRTGNTRKARLIADFEASFGTIKTALANGERIVELRGV